MWGLKTINHALFDLFFPEQCKGCGKDLNSDYGLCIECRTKITAISGNCCPACALPFQGKGGKHLCPDCSREHPGFSTKAIVVYEEPVKTLVQRLKYAGDLSVLKAIESFVDPRELFEDIDIVLPVPLSLQRLRRRGYNQALLLARLFFSEQKGKIFPDILKKPRNTVPQSGLSKQKRIKNVQNAFVIDHQSFVRGKRICLVDDVMTTGATVRECSKLLKKCGAESVCVVVFARTPK